MYPLALRMRPNCLKDIVGQKHLLSNHSFLINSIEENILMSIILYGPPGTGKTTIAEAYAKELNAHIIRINATQSNKKDLENAIFESKTYPSSVLIIDEIHRLNKDKQDILLPALENGDIYLIGATTANPYISINKAIRSRVHLLEVKPLDKNDIKDLIMRAIESKNGLNNKIKLNDECLNYLSSISGGDCRYALNMLEVIFVSLKYENNITIDDLKNIISPNILSDKDEDEHYNLLSALQKSIRGSDVNASLFYLAKLCTFEDLTSLSRRLLVIAYEDIGLGNVQAVDRTYNAIKSAQEVGFPEAIIPLGYIVIDLALSPKSRTCSDSIEKTIDFTKNNVINVQHYLKYTPVGYEEEDKYPYNGYQIWSKIQYLPDEIKNMEFIEQKGSSLYEKALFENYNKLKSIKRSNNIRELRKLMK